MSLRCICSPEIHTDVNFKKKLALDRVMHLHRKIRFNITFGPNLRLMCLMPITDIHIYLPTTFICQIFPYT